MELIATIITIHFTSIIGISVAFYILQRITKRNRYYTPLLWLILIFIVVIYSFTSVQFTKHFIDRDKQTLCAQAEE